VADDLGERTEDATPKRKEQAREQGQVPKSTDFAGAVLLLVVTLALWAGLGTMLGRAKILLGQILDDAFVSDPLTIDGATHLAWYLGRQAVVMVLPLLLIIMAAGVTAHLLQSGWNFAPKTIMPKLSKLNPISGFKRIFGVSGLVKASLDSLKVAIVVTVSVVLISSLWERIIVLPYLPVIHVLVEIGRMMLYLALCAVAVLLLLGLLDLMFQKWKHAQDLKMTKQQVKDEMKQSEGDPEVKKRRIRMAQQLALQRIGAAVPQADVVVTNPQHLSIAIKYDGDNMHAPRVVAKGAELLAFRIRQIALMHGIPIVERKPLARALYRQVEVGQEIPPQFYQAVAEILAYVYRLGTAESRKPKAEMV
jgi:flagellar biosynthetic protein FlhB